MLSAYFDESGIHLEACVTVVAGLLASPAKWERLTTSWAKLLRDSGIPDFHASDCVSGGGIFRGWDVGDREKLYARFVGLVKNNAAYRLWTVIVKEDFHLHYNDRPEKIPYRLCAVGCAARVKSIAVRRGPDFVIPFVFDQGPKGKWIQAMFRTLVKQGRGKRYYRMGSISEGDRRKMLPLQAADLHAYEVYRYFSDQWQHGRREARKEFRSLWAIPDAGGYVLTGDQIFHLNSEWRRQEREGLNEPIPLPVYYLNGEFGVKLEKI